VEVLRQAKALIGVEQIERVDDFPAFDLVAAGR
jgi:hypothetical protein